MKIIKFYFTICLFFINCIMTIAQVPPNDIIANAMDIDQVGNNFIDIAVQTQNATSEPNGQDLCTVQNVQVVWYKFTAVTSDTIRGIIVDPGAEPIVRWYTAQDEFVNDSSELTFVDTFGNPCSFDNQTFIQASIGQTYYIAVSNIDAPTDIEFRGPPLGSDFSCEEYQALGLPLDIDINNNITDDCLNMPNQYSVEITENYELDLNVYIDEIMINIEHTFSGDLQLSLISPNGTSLLLANNLGGSTSNAYTGTIFRLGGEEITTASPPFTSGTYSPQGGDLATIFSGEEIQGDWTLQVCDTADENSGQVNAFSISFCAILNVNRFNDINIQIYPNPTHETINLNSEQEIIDVVIRDFNGREIERYNNLISRNFTIDVSHFSSAIYFMEVRSEMGQTVKRFVKL